jgi:hypothetical protein
VTDWRANGDLIRDRARRFLSAHAIHEFETNTARYGTVRGGPWVQPMPAEWLATGFSEDYDHTRFDYVKWLRAHPERMKVYDPPLQGGRPIAESSRAAATLAYCFYETWRRENKNAGIRDYGHRGEMKDFAARAIVEDIYAVQFQPPSLAWQFTVESAEKFVELVRELMDKPRHRRDAGAHACIHYVASATGLVFDFPPKPPPK